MIFRACQHEFRFPRPAMIMGILNVTPDSFYDGGKYVDPGAAEARALAMVEQGAEIIDVGGESTRPGAPAVPEAEELRRVLPVIERLAARIPAPISIDTQKPAVAGAALRAGARIVNDVAGNRADTRMWEVVAAAGAGYVLMHMQGTPETMQQAPAYGNVVAEVNGFFLERLGRLRAAGVGLEQVVLDVGIGFGKTVEHNLELLAAVGSFAALGRPLLLGVSRKSFIGKLLGAAAADRLPAALACASLAIAGGANIIRTHDVAETLQAVRMTEAILHSHS